MNPTSADETLINSDFPLDKVIYLGQITQVISLNADVIIQHGLPFIPLVKIVWSTTPDFFNVYGVEEGPVSTVSSAAFAPNLALAYADATNINMSFGAIYTDMTAYIRIYAFMPSNVNDAAAFTSSQSDIFVMNSEYNYSKLYLNGVTDSSSVRLSTVSVIHDLSFIPQVEAWHEINGRISPLSNATLFNYINQGNSASVNDSSLVFTRGSFISAPQRFHYRIYADRLQ